MGEKEKNINGKSKKLKISKKKVVRLIVILAVIALIVCFAAICVNRSNLNKTVALTKANNSGITDSSGTKSWDLDYITIYEDTSMVDSNGNPVTTYVPIPKGYQVSSASSESTVAGGLVIYELLDTDDPETFEITDSNVTEMKASRNQYVWIPTDVSEICWTDTDGQNYGVEYTYSNNKVTAGTTKMEPLLPTNVYHYDYYMDWNSYNDGTDNSDSTDRRNTHSSDEESALNVEAVLQIEFDELVESISKYGGFYVGRYETGANGVTSRSYSSGISTEPVIRQYVYPYNYLSWYDSFDLAKTFSEDKEYVTSCMLYGTLYDRILNFIMEMGDKTYDQIVVDSGEWGNYNNQEFEYINMSGSEATKKSGSSTITPTGSALNDRNISLNIYDLAGNMWEWTSEAASASSATRRVRGGSYSTESTTYPASYRNSSYVSTRISHRSFRAVLYIM